MKKSVSLRVAMLAIASAIVGMTWSVAAHQSSDPFKSLSFRELGPTRQGGRFVDFAVVESTPRIFYAASASGGVYKTESNGVSFTQVFDNGGTASIGAIALAQSNPDVVYIGTGEGNNSRTIYYGDGVYKSTDAGKTWANVGLKDSQHIGRIVVHPTDPNTAYVAALGHLYSDNDERGLYKTIDGGKTWTKSLDIKSNGKAVGVVDVAMDPKNPLVLYAATYERLRKPFTFSPGGPGSGLYKTMDGGKTWNRLEGGLPAGPLGRIGISISRQDPNTVYAIVEVIKATTDEEKKRLAAGFGDTLNDPTFRSDDAGRTWRQVAPASAPAAGAAASAGVPAGRGGAPTVVQGPRGGGYPANDTPYYYSNIRVDPNDKNHIFVLNTGAAQSPDGGTTWQPLGAGGDNHALWIDPKDSKHMLLGYDHGMSLTFDGGAHWYHPDNLATAQCMGIGYDMAQPYNVYCGLQDNGSKMGPSTMKGGGNIPFEAWTNTGGGDGQQNIVELQTSRYLYNESQFGALGRLDLWTGQTKGFGGNGRGSGAGTWTDGSEIRWNWNAPIVASPHSNEVVYHGANFVLKSVDRGETWEKVSPDLTKNDPSTRGGTGNVSYATLTALAESPIVPGVLWAGSDDGNVQVTKDGGKTWTNVTDKITGHPGYWVSRIEPSNVSAGTAYVSVTGFRNDDFRPLLWKTTDYGATWTSLANGLPNQSINTVREDPYNADLLFVGTDLGLYGSIDAGKSWMKITGSVMAAAGGGGRGGGGGFGGGGAAEPRGVLPTTPVYDLKIHPRDHELILGTHGRGIWVADISALEELTPAVQAADAHLMAPSPYIQWNNAQRGETSSVNFAGVSRPAGVAINYTLKTAATGDVKIRIYDGARQIQEIDGTKNAGINTVRWNLSAQREAGAVDAAGGGRGGRGGRGGAPAGGGGQIGYTVSAGEYRVVLMVGGKEYTQNVLVMPDPGK
jgi:photosystem II stability/assembly factor-like uncharacterized protein